VNRLNVNTCTNKNEGAPQGSGLNGAKLRGYCPLNRNLNLNLNPNPNLDLNLLMENGLGLRLRLRLGLGSEASLNLAPFGSGAIRVGPFLSLAHALAACGVRLRVNATARQERRPYAVASFQAPSRHPVGPPLDGVPLHSPTHAPAACGVRLRVNATARQERRPYAVASFRPLAHSRKPRLTTAETGGRLRRRLRWTDSECPSLSVVVAVVVNRFFLSPVDDCKPAISTYTIVCFIMFFSAIP
jgi:hypothetical protein